MKDVIVGIFNRNDVLNYLIILGKLCIWECRRNKSLPKFNMFLQKVEAKQETEKASRFLEKMGTIIICTYFQFSNPLQFFL